jgi:predicted dehydrogenase
MAAGVAIPALRSPLERRAKKDVKVRLAVVGGGFGASHHWHEHPHCEITAVSDLVEDRRQGLSKHYGCPNVYPSLEAMLEKAAETFDAVAIFTDAPSHAKHANACLEAGKHVVSACPVAMTLEECWKLREARKRTGLKYMLHESSYYRQSCIAARELYEAGEFGRIVYSEVEYYHPGIGTGRDSRSRWRGLKSWRYGLPPLLYPTHSLGLVVGVTGERIVKVSCYGQRVGSDFPEAKDNAYRNPFDNEMAIGVTDRGNICRFGVFWMVAADGERGQWFGDKMSCYMGGSGGQPRARKKMGSGWRPWNVPEYWKTDRLPEPMRHASGHGGSSVFLCHEFVQSLIEDREPSVGMELIEDREPSVGMEVALAMNVPGIVAHQSALQGGEQLEVPQ